MTILSDIDIKNSIGNKDLSIEPFNEKNLTPNGYDLSIDEIFIKKTDEHIKEGKAVIPPLTWFAISTKEFVKMGPQITSQLWIRSSYARKVYMVSPSCLVITYICAVKCSCLTQNEYILCTCNYLRFY